MTAEQQPRVSLALLGIRTLSDVVRWAELAEALEFPLSSKVTSPIGGTNLAVSALLTQVGVPEVFVRCSADSACILAEHDHDGKHFDGRVAWGGVA